MHKRILKQLLLVLFLFPLASFGQTDFACLPINTLNNKSVTRKNIHEFFSSMPHDLQEKVDLFLSKNQHIVPLLIKQKLPDDYFTQLFLIVFACLKSITKHEIFSDYTLKMLYAQFYLMSSGIKNLSKPSSYIFDIPGTNYVMRISGPKGRACLQRCAGLSSNAPTYQAASVLFHHMRMREFLKKHPDTPVIIAQNLYPYCVSKEKEHMLSDSNCAVLISKLTGYASVQQRIKKNLWKHDMVAYKIFYIIQVSISSFIWIMNSPIPRCRNKSLTRLLKIGHYII